MVDHGPPTCPACGSSYISAGERGFNVRRAIGGGLLLGGAGLLAGAVGRKGMVLGCMTCGHRWEPSLPAAKVAELQDAAMRVLGGEGDKASSVTVSTKGSLIAIACFMAFIAALCAGALLSR